MGLTSDIKNMTGVVTVQVEGFFTERFINLCKINNIKIWDIRNVVKGVVRFKINISAFKKLRPIARKTKCKVEIKDKKGLYFTMFKYRKRKLVIVLIAILILSSIGFSTFIWNINVTGNDKISKEEIIQKLEASGIHIGKNKIGLDKKKVINNLRVELEDISWVGIDIDGTTANIKVIEKTKLDDKNIQRTQIGDIIANKAGIITKIVPENGTAIYKEGSYVEKGSVLIQGTIYSKFLEPKQVSAKGIIKMDCEYELKKEYKYKEIKKEYTGKVKYTIGIGINSKENMLNYLNKSKKYDITKKSKEFNMFGTNISLDWYECVEYNEIEEIKDKNMLIEDSNADIQSYIDSELFPKINSPKLVDKSSIAQDIESGITVTTKLVINEQIGEFIERNT